MTEIIPNDFKSLDISVNRGMHRVVHIKQGRASVPATGVDRPTLTGQVIETILADRDPRDKKDVDQISKIHVKCE